ncbi:SDR family NAD(P)-dependent oxidoreductase [Tessaracoccus palaemonis]|uniref:SDR family NAD(P)-dependent oxidoreductase n=1 Tax=Tessaracoccus palaemonis TaxID=2829499 RepID=A0ABX8SJF8_9ACTN|nr:SDR family NAD(P)-dependent oxidoreductase [Tessaracoccus palaemonis]QXT63522.1 SDR family NAD(P)-dependent oxidoreductase [Tessaracoccus palaemonis]
MGTERIVVITGASDGIGAAAARALHARGDRVVVVGRNPAKTEAVARELDAEFHVADYADLAQVRSLAAALDRLPRIDVLANNAGAAMLHRRITVDGFEATLQVNHLAPFLLTSLLLPKLIASKAVVIQTSSIASRLIGGIDLDDLQSERHYAVLKAYGRAKLAQNMFTRELARRYGAQGLLAAAFHPGIVGSNFGADSSRLIRLAYHSPLKRLITVTPEQGADQLVWLATSPPYFDGHSGEYYENRLIVGTAARDRDLARRMWERSAELVGAA